MQLSAPTLPFDPTSLLPSGLGTSPEGGLPPAVTPSAVGEFGALLTAETAPAAAALAAEAVITPSPGFCLGASRTAPSIEDAPGVSPADTGISTPVLESSSPAPAVVVADQWATWLAANGLPPAAAVPATVIRATVAETTDTHDADVQPDSDEATDDASASAEENFTPGVVTTPGSATPSVPDSVSAPAVDGTSAPVSSTPTKPLTRAQVSARTAQVRAVYAQAPEPRENFLPASSRPESATASTADAIQEGREVMPDESIALKPERKGSQSASSFSGRTAEPATAAVPASVPDATPPLATTVVSTSETAPSLPATFATSPVSESASTPSAFDSPAPGAAIPAKPLSVRVAGERAPLTSVRPSRPARGADQNQVPTISPIVPAMPTPLAAVEQDLSRPATAPAPVPVALPDISVIPGADVSRGFNYSLPVADCLPVAEQMLSAPATPTPMAFPSSVPFPDASETTFASARAFVSPEVVAPESVDAPLPSAAAPLAPLAAMPLAAPDLSNGEVTLLSVSTSDENVPEKIAAESGSSVTEVGSVKKSPEKKSLVIEKEQFETASRIVGTNVAKTRSNMPLPASTASRSSIDDVPASLATPALDFAALVKEAPAPTALPESASAARRTVESVLAVADHFTTGGQHGVNLKFSVGGIDLAVRVEVRGGTVQATFRTDSPELRNALASEWRAVAAESSERSHSLAEPVFTSSAANRDGLQSGAGGASDQRGSGARQEQSPFAEAATAPRFAARRPAFASPSTAVPASGLPAATPGRLHVLA